MSCASLDELNNVTESGTRVINTNFQITFHCMDLFKELLEANNLDFSLIERSLSPVYNRE